MASIITTVSDGGARPTRPAGFWIRFVAALLDGVVITLAQASMSFAAARIWGGEVDESSCFAAVLGLFTMIFSCIYSTVAHAVTGQTIGKALVGVRVVAVDGAPLAVGAALLRWLSYFVSALPLGMGFVIAGLRMDKRDLQSLIAGSRVERLAGARPAERFHEGRLPGTSCPSAVAPTPVVWPRGSPRSEPQAETPPSPGTPPPGLSSGV